MIGFTQYAFAGASFENLEGLNGLLTSAQHGLKRWDEEWAGRLPVSFENRMMRLCAGQKDFALLDRVVLLSMLLAKEVIEGKDAEDILVISGSARGATQTLEVAMEAFLSGERLSPQTSPTTTAGSISAMTARHIGAKDGAVSMSMTCSSGLQAVVHACHLRELGHTSQLLVGGIEAPLTPFTKAQFNALRLLSKGDQSYPCRPLSYHGNQVVLSEGGGYLLLEESGRYEIIGWGESMSLEGSSVTFSEEAMARSMRKALQKAGIDQVDIVVPHAPGTQLGDRLEMKAILGLIPNAIIYSSKWATGHSLGASGMLGIGTAILLLEGNCYSMPHLSESMPLREIKTVMVNASGFGGNCTSVILRKRG